MAADPGDLPFFPGPPGLYAVCVVKQRALNGWLLLLVIDCLGGVYRLTLLAHLDKIIPSTEAACLLESRAPPQAELIE